MRRALPFVLVALAGCAYYNGMYNANRLAHRAQKAEREGRTFEAQAFWAQAEVRADSVIVRHPESNWADDAQLIRGEAMVSRGDCEGALPALEAAALSRDSPKVVEQAQALLGQCRLDVGDYAGADRAFVALLESADSSRRTNARLQHARLLRMDGEYQAALASLDGLEGPGADAERAADYAGLGELAEAQPLVDAALARQDLAVPWDSILAGIGRVDPGLASRYAADVAALPGLTPEQRGQILMADGLRLLPTQPDSGLARLRAAAGATPITNASLTARLRLAEYAMSQADTLAALEAAREGLTSLSEVGGPNSIRALGYLAVLDRARVYADSVMPGAPRGDLATFVLGEEVRDGLPAPRVAGQLFGAVPAWWPASPYAPKALLALAALRPEAADSILQVLETAYAGSPYLLLLSGDVTPAVLALEDSLQVYTGAAAPGAVPDVRRAPAAPAGRRQDDLK